MDFKKILAGIITVSLLSANAFAFTPYLQESDVSEDIETETETEAETEAEAEAETEAEAEEVTDNESTDGNEKADVVTKLPSRNTGYNLFMDILETYVAEHLYETTEEEVINKFFYDFLGDNPAYTRFFIDYMLGTMDPYSSYRPGSSGFLEPDKGSSGFGFIIKDSNDGVFIDKVLPESEAEKAGFKPGDRFVSIEGINVERHTFDIVSTILAGPAEFSLITPEEAEPSEDSTEATATPSKKTVFEIVVDRKGENITFNISKGPMTLSMVESYIDENDGKPTAYISVSSFLGDDTEEKFVDLVKQYAQDGIKHLTIDVRDNGGGSLDYALAMAEIFLEKDALICYYEDKNTTEPIPVYSTNEKISFDSVTVLANENTASAAELFTSILKDHGIAKVIGAKTFGKSLGQTVYALSNGDYITITTYQMLGKNLDSYDGIGIIPDLAIENVEMCYTLPPLGVFNHKNFTEIKEGVYSDVTKALEDRLVVMDLLREEYCDGIFDDMTKTVIYLYQKDHGLNATGYVDYDTVSKITKTINAYKPITYYEDSQYDVAMIVHHSFSQGKRLVNEKERLRKDQAKMIEERDAALNAAYDALHPET